MGHPEYTVTPWKMPMAWDYYKKLRNIWQGLFKNTALWDAQSPPDCHQIVTNDLGWWDLAGHKAPDYPLCFAPTIDRIDTPIVRSINCH